MPDQAPKRVSDYARILGFGEPETVKVWSYAENRYVEWAECEDGCSLCGKLPLARHSPTRLSVLCEDCLAAADEGLLPEGLVSRLVMEENLNLPVRVNIGAPRCLGHLTNLGRTHSERGSRTEGSGSKLLVPQSGAGSTPAAAAQSSSPNPKFWRLTWKPSDGSHGTSTVSSS